ncbi:hypothetical protein [Kutzneria kofuensis]|uniref:Uncharacterized protein n=1 Tax=Kutzneria kofuensis TaxID=103725 RepID=A0A7W9KF17_9PSEU|nr:hypothetical protein [Kutzneria kofuensis]MBB5891437.1 hypothetical protein [Kutzneria kofuensis]
MTAAHRFGGETLGLNEPTAAFAPAVITGWGLARPGRFGTPARPGVDEQTKPDPHQRMVVGQSNPDPRAAVIAHLRQVDERTVIPTGNYCYQADPGRNAMYLILLARLS